MDKWFKVFRAGTHTDSQGRTHTFSNEDVEKIANAYNEQTDHSAPLVKGHPKDDEPAHGWVDKLKAEGGELYAKFKDFSNDIITDIKEKKFQFPSISVYKNGLLRHVGLLGAVPPAVKGLGAFELSEDIEGKDAAVFSFNEDLEKDGFSSFDYQDPKEDLLAEIQKQKELIDSLTKKVSDLNSFADDNTKLKEKIQFAEADQAAAEAKLKELSLKIRTIEFQQYLNERIAYGSLTPVQSRRVLKLIEALDTVNLSEHEGKQVFEFSDIDEKGESIKVKENPLDILREFVDSLPKTISTIETDPNKVQPQNNDEADFAEFSEKYPEAEKEQIQLLVDARKLMKTENITFDKAIVKINSNKK